jgi:hypothetical protein
MATAWPTLPTFEPLDTLPAASLTTIVQALNHLKERVDAGGSGGAATVEFKTTSGTGTLTATAAGVFVVAGYVNMAAGGANYAYTITAGGASAQAHAPGSAGIAARLSASVVVRLSAGATVTASASGGTVNSGRLAMARIGA